MLKQKLFYIKSFPMDISPPLQSPICWGYCLLKFHGKTHLTVIFA